MQRIEYFKVDGCRPKRVICDLDEDAGREEYAEQEAGEVKWFPFTPSEQERGIVRQLLFPCLRTGLKDGPVRVTIATGKLTLTWLS